MDWATPITLHSPLRRALLTNTSCAPIGILQQRIGKTPEAISWEKWFCCQVFFCNDAQTEQRETGKRDRKKERKPTRLNTGLKFVFYYRKKRRLVGNYLMKINRSTWNRVLLQSIFISWGGYCVDYKNTFHKWRTTLESLCDSYSSFLLLTKQTCYMTFSSHVSVTVKRQGLPNHSIVCFSKHLSFPRRKQTFTKAHRTW